MSDEVIIKGLSRLAHQFKDSIKFQDFLTSFLQQLQDLYISDLQLLNERYLDIAVGIQLDGIGEIVGLPRPEKEVDVAGLFGFLTDPTSLGFGTILNSDIGGNFWDGVSQKVLIGDNLYRLLIRAKIIKNQTAMTVDDTLKLISFTFGDVEVRYFLSENLKPRYDIGKELNLFESSLLSDFPILIGLDSVKYHSYSETTSFGFSDDLDAFAFGFGDINNSNLGGNFAKIIT